MGKANVDNEGIKRIPFAAMNPMLNVLRFEWFMYYLSVLLKKEKKVNVFILHNSANVNDRKKYGVLRAAFHHKRLVEAVRSENQISLFGEYDSNKILIVSEEDLQEELTISTQDEKFEVVTGATASISGDNEFSILHRALNALSTAQRKKISFQTL